MYTIHNELYEKKKMEGDYAAMGWKKTVAVILALLTFLSIVPAAAATSIANQTLYISASDWAKSEISNAWDNGLIPSGLLSKKAAEPATREELCELATLLYEKMTGKTVTPFSPNPFTDTSNPAIHKAYAIGVTKGTSDTNFPPGEQTNRQEVATMFGRAIREMFPNDDYSTVGAPTFSDQADISAWALDHVLFMSKMGIIKGSNEGKFMPQAITDAQKASGYGTTTREQAVAISARIYDTYASAGYEEDFAEALIDNTPVKQSETEKLSAIDFNNRVFRPLYNPVISLSVSDGSSSGQQTTSPYTVISPNGDKKATFQLHTRSGALARAQKIVWQVSPVPFDGAPVTSAGAKPGGLLLSGELSVGAKSFTVDFSEVYAAEQTLQNPNARPNIFLPSAPLLNNIQLPGIKKNWLLSNYGDTSAMPPQTYYVRAYPVDAAGNSIGDAGSGMPVLYGDPLSASGTMNISLIQKLFSLKLANYAGDVYYTTEFPNKFTDETQKTLTNANSSSSWSVLPSDFPADTKELRIQVSLVDFVSTSQDSWRNVAGLVYEKTLLSTDQAFMNLSDSSPLGIAIDFDEFVPPDSELPDDSYIAYYIRAVALADGARAGTASASYSKTVMIQYGKDQSPSVKILEQVKITPPIPTLEKVTYTPVKWEATDWQYPYVVTRQPTKKEVFGSIIGDDTLYAPYTVGTKLDFTPQPENKSWWEKAWDAITDFFGSVVEFLKAIVNWVSTAYADLKSGLINIVVSALPSSLQGPLRVALTALVDYGLASIGIPPSLPNFDELAEMGTDYLATMAMQQAGIPAGSLTEYGLEELSGKVADALADSASKGSPNPMGWDFIELDPDYLYRPAYLLVDLYNPYDFATPKGYLSFTAETLMDMSKNGYNPSVTRLYAAYGSTYISLYKPVFGMEIPALEPGQHLTVPVILEEYVGIPFPGCTAPVDGNDYPLIYGGLGAYNFNLYIQYELPPIAQEIARQKYTEEAIYTYSTLGNNRSFTIAPNQSYSG